MTRSQTIAILLAITYPTMAGAGDFVYASNQYAARLSVIDSATNSVVAVIPIPGNPNHFAIVPGGATAYVGLSTYTGQPKLAVVDLRAQSVVDSIPLPFNPGPIALNAEGTRAWILPDDDSQTAVPVDLLYKDVGRAVTVGLGPLAIALTPDGQRAYVANQTSGTVSVIDTGLGSVIGTIPVGIFPDGIAVNPLGTEVWVANDGSAPGLSSISIISTFTNTVIANFSVPAGPTRHR